MPIGEIVKKMFATDPKIPRETVRRTWIDTLEKDDKEAREEAQRYLDWHDRDREKILEYLKDLAAVNFGEDVKTEWHFPILNPVPRTVKRLSQAYRYPPKRELMLKGETVPRGEKEIYDQLKRLYGNFDPDSRLKDVDRFGTLLNTVHVEVVPRYGGIDWDVHLRPKVTVLPHPDNYLDFVKFAHYWKAMDPEHASLVEREGWVYWSEEEHFFVRKHDHAKIGLTDKEGALNPYRDKNKKPVIPIATLRKIEQQEYWGQFGADLVNAAESAGVQLANLWNTVFKQVGGIPFAINCDIKSGRSIRISPGRPITANNVTKDMAQPDFRFVSPDPQIEEVMNLVDWMIKEIGATYGLPPSAWALEEKRMSGIAKFIDNLELLESREDEMSMWQRFEADLFKKSVIVYNYWAKAHKVEPIDPKLELKVVFQPPQFPESPTEKAQRLAAEFAAGINSPIDYFMKQEGLTEEEATEKAMKIAERNRKVQGPRRGGMPAFEELEVE